MASFKDRQQLRKKAAFDSISLRSLATETSVPETPIPASRTESKDVLLASYQDTTQPVSRPRRPTIATISWRKPFTLSTITFIGHLLLTLCPCLFLILSLAAWIVNNDPVTSRRGQVVEQASRLGPTLFPIMFAAVCGRLMRTWALWRAEKGESLGILEQLNGSQNLLSALERAILIPGLGFTSLIIVLLWLLSPIGGQSSLRVLGRGTSALGGETPVYYLNTSAQGGGTAFAGASAYSELENGLNAVFQAALTSLGRVKGRDTWGNVKIPVLQYLNDQVKVDDWLKFDENAYEKSYSALNGLVISGLSDNIDFNFTIESSYFNLTCADPAFFNTSLPGMAGGWGGLVEWGSPFVWHTVNGSFQFASRFTTGWNSYMLDTNYNSTTNYERMLNGDPEPHYNLIYATLYGAGMSMNRVVGAYNCTVGRTHAESDIVCKGRDCGVRRIRPSRKFGPSYSGWPWPTYSVTPAANLIMWMETATTMSGSGSFSPIDAYVSGSDIPFDVQQEVDYQNITADQVAERLQSLVNTGWQLAYQGSATAQEPYANMTALALLFQGDGSNSTAFSEGMTYPVATVMATTTITTDIFVVHWTWLAVNIVVSSILLFCGIVGMFFRYKSHCPDIFGFVSSMTRDNPNFGHIPGGDKMDGFERARVMRNVRVQVVDIAPWGEGHITLRNIGTCGKAPEIVSDHDGH